MEILCQKVHPGYALGWAGVGRIMELEKSSPTVNDVHPGSMMGSEPKKLTYDEIEQVFKKVLSELKSLKSDVVGKREEVEKIEEILVEVEKSEVIYEVPIVKADKKLQVGYAPVLIPGWTDSQGDSITSEQIQKSAHDYMTESRQADLQHKKVLSKKDAHPVESWLLQKDEKFGNEVYPAGTWMVGMKVDNPDIWDKIEKGEITGFSIRGWGKRKSL